ncbi:protein NRT1/ PTR FAMILY 8.3-like [Quercus lobata]|uniref:protein NRT1/ PTR FAMILY 8.3-like n=1 Tax=Quercus lobata TaxID=97700 RepID=UPI001243D448|nr:protein NRT1/ PTR FAMILY 8.3-like [Quercus lobata]
MLSVTLQDIPSLAVEAAKEHPDVSYIVTAKELCLDKAAVVSDAESKSEELSNPWRLCTVTQVEELKIVICMFPIWATGIVFSAVYAQMCTMFVEQGMMMDTSIGSFTIPAASLSSFDVISFIFWVPMYDRVIIPIARKFFAKERDCMTRFIL